MSRYIDAEWLLRFFEPFGDNYHTPLGVLRACIDDAPSIDIVPCSECIHNPWKEDCDYTCIWDDDFANRPQTPNDFCSYGEREGE